jgi:ferredoxin/flavodoxin---NADP+ reductase
MEITADRHYYVIAIVGGATAGSAAAEIFASQGIVVIVFDQNDRPYGKIEDGLPRWHAKQRRNEYERIDARLNRPWVQFVPNTRLGRDIGFDELTQDWGLSAVLLANGAWKDRPLQVPDVDRFVDRGLVYQNPFVYWFNHKNESAYSGPRYHLPEATMVVGGGLASIDVIKVVQLELYERALRARGVLTDMYELELKGIPEICRRHGLDPAQLGVKNGILFYRRRAEDMPLAQAQHDATPEQIKKTESVRLRLLDKAREKFLFEFHDRHMPVAALVEGDRLVGLRFARTKVEGRSAMPIPGSEVDVRSELTISSIGSVPEPLAGVQMKGEYYVFKSSDTGEYAAREGVFAAGNVVTGQGNIRVSLIHGQAVAHHIVEQYLGLTDRQPDYRYLPTRLETMAVETANAMLEDLTNRAPLPGDRVLGILERARRRQAQVGYTGDYAGWIRKVLPPDLE